MRIFRFLLLVLIFSYCSAQNNAPEIPKNIIIMIGDGMGFEHIQTALFFQGKENDNVFKSFPVKLAMSTYPAELTNTPTTGYNPSKAWTDKDYATTGFTESAAAGTALATGLKTKVDKIGMSVSNDQLTNITQIAKSLGKSAGVISSVEFSHATPAAFSAHNITRENYSDIALEMIFSSQLDVIMGCGHPFYDTNGNRVLIPDYKYVGGEKAWKFITLNNSETTEFNGFSVQDINNDGKPDNWFFSDNRQTLKDIANHKIIPDRLLFVAPVSTTLQQERTEISPVPFASPPNKNIPTLEEMTIAGLEVLSKNPNGFFLMIEGGAIDWASHENDVTTLIEEVVYFTNTIERTIQWLTDKNLWDSTLLIVVADHECGYLTGGWDDTTGFIPVASSGKGNIPKVIFNSKDHTNHLVPFFARGTGQELFPKFASNFDYVRGYYIDITSITSFAKLFWADPVVVYPASVTSCNNVPVTLYASVSYLPATYQWYRNNTLLKGENKPTLTVNPNTGGKYHCLVNYGFKTNVSNVAFISFRNCN